jgi:uncharacterized protein (TIGR00369 family)
MEDARVYAEAMLARPPLHQWLGVRIGDIDLQTDTVTVHLPHRAELSRSPDRADYHGGIIATLIDIAGHACLAAKLRRRMPTIDMRIDYLRPAVETDLRAVARVIRSGRTIGLCDIAVFDDSNRQVAAGRCVFSTREN